MAKLDQWQAIVNKRLNFPLELIAAIQKDNSILVGSLLSTGDGIIRQLDESEDQTLMFMQMMSLYVSMAIFGHSFDDSQFAPGVTPLTQACQKDLYEIVTMLTKKGHASLCLTLSPWRNGRQYDLLKFSLSRINTYRGMASRAYLSITTEDAMLSALRLIWKSCVRNLQWRCWLCVATSEVTTILNDDELDEQTFEEGNPTLSRLCLAVNYDQKLFVSHPISQQVLSSIWCGNILGWRGSKTV
ncbi:unnamed protein product [Coregonus sp. 'balchen']|nr:unnamed protein product [Coregonus sp. 'balchen']